MSTTSRPRSVLLVATAAVAGIAAVSLVAPGAIAKPKAPTVTGAWARTSPAGVTTGAAYMTIKASTTDKLLGASVLPSVAKTVQIHETVMATPTTMAGATASTMAAMSGDMGAMTMREVTSIALPAGKSVVLKPGGYHMMLIDLAAPLKTGTSFTMTLKFEKAGTLNVKVPVKES